MKITTRELEIISSIINVRPKSGESRNLAWGWKINRYGKTYVVFGYKQEEPFRAFRYVYDDGISLSTSVVERPGWIARIRTVSEDFDRAVLHIIAAQRSELRDMKDSEY